MPKVKKIRVLGPKVKKVRELSGEGNDEEIKEITASEVPMDEPAPVSSGSFDSERSEARNVAPVSLNVPGETVQERERIQESRLYEARGKALSPTTVRAAGDDDRDYIPVESIQADRVRKANVGRDFAMNQQRSLMPESRGVQTGVKIRAESESERKYDEGLREGGRRKRRSDKPWEI